MAPPHGGYAYEYSDGYPPPSRTNQVRNDNRVHNTSGWDSRRELEQREHRLALRERQLEREESQFERLKERLLKERLDRDRKRRREKAKLPGRFKCKYCPKEVVCPMKGTTYGLLPHSHVSIHSPQPSGPAKDSTTPPATVPQTVIDPTVPPHTQPHVEAVKNVNMNGLKLVPDEANNAVPTARDSQELRKDRDMQAVIYPYMKTYDNEDEDEDDLATSQTSPKASQDSFLKKLFKRKKSEASTSQFLGRSPSVLEQEAKPRARVQRKFLNARRATLDRAHYGCELTATDEEPSSSPPDNKLDFTCRGLVDDIYDTTVFTSFPTNAEIQQVSTPAMQRSLSDSIIPGPQRPMLHDRACTAAPTVPTVDEETAFEDGAQSGTQRSSSVSDFDGTPSELLDDEPGRLGLPTLKDYKAISASESEIYCEDGRRLSSLFVTKMGSKDVVPFRPDLIDLEAAQAQGIVLKSRFRSTAATADSHDELPNVDRQTSFNSFEGGDSGNPTDRKVPILKRIKKSLTDLRGASRKMSSSNLRDNFAAVTATPNGVDIPALPGNSFPPSTIDVTERAQYTSGSTLVNTPSGASKTTSFERSTSHVGDNDQEAATAHSPSFNGYFSGYPGYPGYSAVHDSAHRSPPIPGTVYSAQDQGNAFDSRLGSATANQDASSFAPVPANGPAHPQSAFAANLPIKASSSLTQEIYLPDVVDIEPSATEADDITKRLEHLQVKLRAAQRVIEDILKLPAGGYPIPSSFEPESGWERVLQMQERLNEAHQFIQTLTAHYHPAFI